MGTTTIGVVMVILWGCSESSWIVLITEGGKIYTKIIVDNGRGGVLYFSYMEMSDMLAEILCWLGMHEWEYVTESERHRICFDCHRREELWKYSSLKASEQWEKVYPGQEFTDFGDK